MSGFDGLTDPLFIQLITGDSILVIYDWALKVRRESRVAPGVAEYCKLYRRKCPTVDFDI